MATLGKVSFVTWEGKGSRGDGVGARKWKALKALVMVSLGECKAAKGSGNSRREKKRVEYPAHQRVIHSQGPSKFALVGGCKHGVETVLKVGTQLELFQASNECGRVILRAEEVGMNLQAAGSTLYSQDVMVNGRSVRSYRGEEIEIRLGLGLR